MCPELHELANDGPVLSLGSSWVMKFWFTTTAWRQNNIHHSGRACSHKINEDGRSGVQLKACSLVVFSPFMFTKSLFIMTVWRILTFTMTFWTTWEKMCDKKKKKRPELWCSHGLLLHYDNPLLTPPTRWCSFWQKKTRWLSHTLFFTWPSPCYFGLFFKIKMKLKGCHFNTVNEV